MNKNKKILKKVLAIALLLSMAGPAVGEKTTTGSAIWPFSKGYSQEEVDAAYEKAFNWADEGVELAKGLDDTKEAQWFIKEFQELKINLENDEKRTYDKATKSRKEIKKLLNDVKASINLQEIERRKAEKRKKEEEHKKAEEHKRKLEEQKLQMEKEERERQEAIKNAAVSLEEKLDFMLRDARKKIENPENVEHINARAAEITEKIQQIDNLNRVLGVEVLFEELQAEITTVLEEEEIIRQENLKKSLEKAKTGLFELRETLQNLLAELDKEDENYSELDSIFVGMHPELINSIDNLKGVDAIKNELESTISQVKVLLDKQEQKEQRKR